MISATPALSSAPRSVVPSEVTTSWPIRSAGSGEDVAVLGQLDVVEAELLQLVPEQARELELPLGARTRVGEVVGLGVDTDVAEEALEGVGLELVGQAQVLRPQRF